MLLILLLIVFLALCLFFVVTTLLKTPHTFLRAGISAVYGFTALGVINVFSALTGFSLGVNYATCLVATLLSFPGVAALAALKVLFSF